MASDSRGVDICGVTGAGHYCVCGPLDIGRKRDRLVRADRNGVSGETVVDDEVFLRSRGVNVGQLGHHARHSARTGERGERFERQARVGQWARPGW